MNSVLVGMEYDARQAREVIDRHTRELREWWTCDEVGGNRDAARYWALLTNWVDQMREAHERGLTNITIAIDTRSIPTAVLGLVSEAAAYQIGLNHWHYRWHNPRLASSEERRGEDANPQCLALHPLSELTVYFS